MFAALLLLLLALLLAGAAIRRAVALAGAGAAAWLVWSGTRDLGASAALALAVLLLISWLLDAASRSGFRALSVGLEIVTAALVTAGFTFLIANSFGSPSILLLGGAALAGAGVVMNWRAVAH